MTTNLKSGILAPQAGIDIVLSVIDFEGEPGRAMFHLPYDGALTLDKIAYIICATDGSVGLAPSYQAMTNGSINGYSITIAGRAASPAAGMNEQWANVEDVARCMVACGSGGKTKFTVHAPLTTVFTAAGEDVDVGGSAPVPVFVAACAAGYLDASAGSRHAIVDEDNHPWLSLSSGKRDYKAHKRPRS